jgi:tryptophanyl-tRNA synthetase
MSKSHPSVQSRILVTDSPKDILSKLKSAVTDSESSISFDPELRPGVANLLTIWSALDSAGRTPEQLAEEANREGWGMGKLKAAVGEVVVEGMKDVRSEYERVRQDHGYLSEVAKKGRMTAAGRATETMDEVRKVIGLDRI